jgi:NADPH:quinone reductase-like Zn-dependent oxidoreductase
MLLIARGKQKPDIQISAAAYSTTVATIRRVFVGNRESFEAMNRAIAMGKIRPVIDRRFSFDDAKSAYAYAREGKAFGKIVITGP